MKIIIAGAGLTGTSIVAYLSQNSKADDIVVIDNNQKALQKLASLYDIQTVHGSSSSPDTLMQAGAKNADVLMALTNSDEVNMVTCQLAYSLFDIPKKIARVESTELLAPLWKKLFNEQNMPVDYIISTSLALAQNVFSLIKVPSATEAIDIKDGKINLLSFKIDDKTPVINAQISELKRLFDDIEISILLIIRDAKVITPSPTEVLKQGDEVIFLSPTADADIAIRAFGKEAQSNEHILIFGANKVSELLLNMLENDSVITNVKLIEEDYNKAQDISAKYSDVQVINGPLLNDVILSEANINKADITLALTDDDKENILISILSNSSQINSNISLLNSRVYDNLLANIYQNISVDRSAVISSLIIKAIRTPELDFAHVLSKNYGEIWGLKLNKRVDYKKINKIKGINVAMILRKDEILYNMGDNDLQQKDYVILFVPTEAIKKAEELFR